MTTAHETTSTAAKKKRSTRSTTRKLRIEVGTSGGPESGAESGAESAPTSVKSRLPKVTAKIVKVPKPTAESTSSSKARRAKPKPEPPSTMIKTKRVPTFADAGAPLRRSPQLGGTPAQIRTRDQLLEVAAAAAAAPGFAARFADAVRTVDHGVLLGADYRAADAGARTASSGVVTASRKGHVNDEQSFTDRHTDARMRDLDTTVRQFMAESDQQGVPGPARERFAAAVLGVVAKDGTKVEAVADAAIDGLGATLGGKAVNKDLPPDMTALLGSAGQAWRATAEADFWTDMAAAAQRVDGASDEAFLREQAAWAGLVAMLSDTVARPTWTWNSAAEKADLVDTLVAAAAGADNAPQAVLRRLGTLTRGADPLPRAVAAELAQLALAALAGVKAAPALDRKGILTLKERPPGQNATPQEQADHATREDLRGNAEALAARQGPNDLFQASLFRDKLSTMYADVKQMLRAYTPNDPTDEDDLPGEQRLDRLMRTVGTFDGMLVDALDAWSTTIASGSTDPADYMVTARAAKNAVDGVLRRINDATDPKDHTQKLYTLMTKEVQFVSAGVEALAAELGQEAGEVLLGHLLPPAEPAAGLRQRLQVLNSRAVLEARLRQARNAGKQTTVADARTLTGLRPRPPGADKLLAAATAFDTENARAQTDPVVLAASAAALVGAGTEARRAVAQLKSEADRQSANAAIDRLYLTAAEELRRVPPVPGAAVNPVATALDRLTDAVTPVPRPAKNGALEKFWSDQKAAAVRGLPAAVRKPLDDAMSRDLRDDLLKLDAAAERGDAAAMEALGWSVVDTLRVYRAAVTKVPKDHAEIRARLMAALDGVSQSVERLLTPTTVVTTVPTILTTSDDSSGDSTDDG